MPISITDLEELLQSYVLSRDVRPSTAAFYRRQVSVFRRWLAVHPQEITEATISKFLADKQAQGRSSHYRKSLRNGLKAVIGDRLDWRRIRPVKLDRLSLRCFTRHEVGLLIRACRCLPAYKREYYRLIIPVAYHTGLAQCDLHLLERKHIDGEGICRMYRNKTGELSITWLPPYLVDQLPRDGLLFPRRWSNEQFRRDFQALCKIAGVMGSFKLLRKTSGTEAEQVKPGEGHKQLANSRKVFERHYHAGKDDRRPIRLPSVRV